MTIFHATFITSTLTATLDRNGNGLHQRIRSSNSKFATYAHRTPRGSQNASGKQRKWRILGIGNDGVKLFFKNDCILLCLHHGSKGKSKIASKLDYKQSRAEQRREGDGASLYLEELICGREASHYSSRSPVKTSDW
jgi:hypothetical protein